MEWPIAERAVPALPWPYTDDTEMALAIVEVLRRQGCIEQDRGACNGEAGSSSREAAGLTQEALTQAAGMHKFGIAKLERGEREPSWATVKTLVKVLGVTCLAFQDNDECPPDDVPPRPRGRPRKAGSEGETDSTGSAELPPVQRKPKDRKTRKPRGD